MTHKTIDGRINRNIASRMQGSEGGSVGSNAFFIYALKMDKKCIFLGKSIFTTEYVPVLICLFWMI